MEKILVAYAITRLRFGLNGPTKVSNYIIEYQLLRNIIRCHLILAQFLITAPFFGKWSTLINYLNKQCVSFGEYCFCSFINSQNIHFYCVNSCYPSLELRNSCRYFLSIRIFGPSNLHKKYSHEFMSYEIGYLGKVFRFSISDGHIF